MRKIIVTGAGGFIGRQVLPLLVERGYEVHGISSENCELDGVQMHTLDLLKDPVDKLLEYVQPSHLLHLAWVTAPGAFWNSPDNPRWVEASLNLIRKFKNHGGTRAVIAGTCAEYDWSYGTCEETTPLNPQTLYGQCKRDLFNQLQKIDLNWGWGRIFQPYGPHEHPKKLIAYVILSLLRGEKALCSDGNQLRDFLHVQDIASAFVSFLDSSVQGALNIASGSPVAIKTLCLKIGEILGTPEKVILGALPPAKDQPQLLVADVKRLYSKLGWKPSFDLDQGLKQTIQWWKENFAEAAV